MKYLIDNEEVEESCFTDLLFDMIVNFCNIKFNIEQDFENYVNDSHAYYVKLFEQQEYSVEIGGIVFKTVPSQSKNTTEFLKFLENEIGRNDFDMTPIIIHNWIANNEHNLSKEELLKMINSLLLSCHYEKMVGVKEFWAIMHLFYKQKNDKINNINDVEREV